MSRRSFGERGIDEVALKDAAIGFDEVCKALQSAEIRSSEILLVNPSGDQKDSTKSVQDACPVQAAVLMALREIPM